MVKSFFGPVRIALPVRRQVRDNGPEKYGRERHTSG